VGTNDDEEERTDHGAESVTGVGDAEATTAATRPRSNEEGNKGEVDAAESESEKEHRRENIAQWGRERAPHAPSAVIKSVPDSTAAPVNRRIESQPIGTPKKAPRSTR